MNALAHTHSQSRLAVETINSNHPGSDFGVIHLETSDSQMSLRECLNLLAQDGWTTTQEVPCARPGVHKFLVSRKK
jgi:hypothetical protein